MNDTIGPRRIDVPFAPTRTRALRLRWIVSQVPAFAVGWSLSQVMGEVVGEAWGGDTLHQLGHTVGSAVLIGLCSAAAWLALRREIRWIGPWAISGSVAAFVGGAFWILMTALTRDFPSELTIALTLYLPLGAAAIAQARAVPRRVGGATAWAAMWTLGVLLGIAVQWFGSGGVDGITVTTVHPVLATSIAYFLDVLPWSALGAIAYAATTAIALPLDVSASDATKV